MPARVIPRFPSPNREIQLGHPSWNPISPQRGSSVLHDVFSRKFCDSQLQLPSSQSIKPWRDNKLVRTIEYRDRNDIRMRQGNKGDRSAN